MTIVVFHHRPHKPIVRVRNPLFRPFAPHRFCEATGNQRIVLCAWIVAAEETGVAIVAGGK